MPDQRGPWEYQIKENKEVQRNPNIKKRKVIYAGKERTPQTILGKMEKE